MVHPSITFYIICSAYPMGNGFFINRSLEEYEMDSFMIQLEYLLKYRKLQSQIADIWRKTRSKEKYQQELFFTILIFSAALLSAAIFLHSYLVLAWKNGHHGFLWKNAYFWGQYSMPTLLISEWEKVTTGKRKIQFLRWYRFECPWIGKSWRLL